MSDTAIRRHSSARPLFDATLDIFLREGAQFSARHDPGDDVVVLCIGARDAITVFATPHYAARLAEAINEAAMTLRSVSDDEGSD